MFPQFQPLSFEENNPFMSGMLMAQKYQENEIKKAYEELQRQELQAKAPYFNDLVKAQLELAQAQPSHMRADTAHLGAETRKTNEMLPGQKEELRLKNMLYPELTRAQIKNYEALSKFREMGGSGLGTGAKEELFFHNLISKDNPHFTPEQVYEASNVIREGGSQLKDGTPVVFSRAAKDSLDRITKSGTYAGAQVPIIQASQSDAELDVFSKYADEFLEPYGTTFLGYSPKQIIDTFKTDKASQERLGKFIAGQALQYEIAQIRNRISRGQPGVESTKQLMSESQQHVDAKYPKLSGEARKVANRELNRVIKEGLEASKTVSTGAFIPNKEVSKEVKKGSKSNPIKLKLVNGQLVEE